MKLMQAKLLEVANAVHLSALAASEVVLDQAGVPLHYKEITKRIIHQELWRTVGKTPDETVNARISEDTALKGPQSKFQRTAPGVYGLRKWDLPETFERAQVGPDPRPEPVTKPVIMGGDASARRLSFADAAAFVLENHGHGQPMHYKRITEVALDLGLVSTSGLTPAASLNSQVVTEIAQAEQLGRTPRFTKLGRGFFGLSAQEPRGLPQEIEKHNSAIRDQLHKLVSMMKPAQFEALVGRLLEAIGFEEVRVTGRSGDGGIDARGTLVVEDVVRIKMAVQAKCWKPGNNVQAPVVREVRGGLGAHEQALIVTSSDFSQGARDEAKRADAVPVALMNGKQLVDRLIRHQLLVKRCEHILLEIGVEEDE